MNPRDAAAVPLLRLEVALDEYSRHPAPLECSLLRLFSSLVVPPISCRRVFDPVRLEWDAADLLDAEDAADLHPRRMRNKIRTACAAIGNALRRSL